MNSLFIQIKTMHTTNIMKGKRYKNTFSTCKSEFPLWLQLFWYFVQPDNEHDDDEEYLEDETESSVTFLKSKFAFSVVPLCFFVFLFSLYSQAPISVICYSLGRLASTDIDVYNIEKCNCKSCDHLACSEQIK